MTEADIMDEIRDANLSYLMLAQNMIRQNRAAAIFRLGLSSEIADLLEGLSSAQLARFRFDDSAILGMLTNYNKAGAQAKAHAAILMAGQPVEEIA